MATGLDPSIILGIGDLNNPNRAAEAQINALKALQAKQDFQAQNSLRQMLQQPGSIDERTGMISQNTMNEMMRMSPEFAYKLAQNQLDLQKTRAEVNQTYMGLVDDAGMPAVIAYDDALKTTGSKEQAQAAAQRAWEPERQTLASSGQLPPEVADKLPIQFNPELFKIHSKQYQAREAEQEKVRHDEALETLGTQRLAQGQERINIQVGKEKEGGFSDEMGDLMGALAEKGVSLPTGFRSKAQQVELYKGLLARNPDKTPDQIADMIKTGQIEFGAQKKETTTAAGVAGKVEVAANEIQGFTPLIRQASAKVPRGRFIPINRLLQMGQTQISDPNLVQLRDYINSMLNAYDLLSARGGTDMEKRAHARGLLTEAQSPEALEAGLEAFNKEADVAHNAAVAATRVPELERAPTKTGAKPKKIGRFTVIEETP